MSRYVDYDDYLDAVEHHREEPEPTCEGCGEPGARPCVQEKSIQYEEGGASFDAPVEVGDWCEECRKEEKFDHIEEWES